MAVSGNIEHTYVHIYCFSFAFGTPLIHVNAVLARISFLRYNSAVDLQTLRHKDNIPM